MEPLDMPRDPVTPESEPSLTVADLASQLERLTAIVRELGSQMDSRERCPGDPHAAMRPTSHLSTAAPLAATTDVSSMNLPPPAPSCSPDINGDEGELLDDDPLPLAVISQSGDSNTIPTSVPHFVLVVVPGSIKLGISEGVKRDCYSSSLGKSRVTEKFLNLDDIGFNDDANPIDGDVARMNHRPTSLDGDKRWIPPRKDTSCLSIMGRVDKLPILTMNFGNHNSHPLMIFDGGLKEPPISPNFTNSVVLLANNRLTRMIPSSFCNASLLVLELSFNNLSGSIPPCLVKISLVVVLNLRGNKISGVIPDQFSSECSLQTFDVSNNNLEALNVGNNNLEGSFPCMLPLSLRSNKFQGDLRCSKSWPNLQILDISSNDFSGRLNVLNFSSLRGMMLQSPTHARLNHSNSTFLGADSYYHDEVNLTVKGTEVKLVKIWPDFTCIDLSSNHFQGKIPDAIANLSSLYLLNLSHNSLTHAIPTSLGALAELGSLDLSSNKLTGRIPDELTKLDFLSFFNVSYNHLTGPIPTGRQFQTFTADSYVGNSGLSGFPLNGSFNNRRPPAPSPSEDSEPKDEEIEWEYVFAAFGYVVGFGSFAWTLSCCRRLRERYFEKIEEITDKIFYERGRRKRHERRKSLTLLSNKSA
ncbi:receptor-like protein 33 [Salvia splendens]|uniref:receptor-like protein 33 n=1 Tax=Salvia splendens TaxID=180675 RepID=UPI001C25CDEB|nr:receptor-like protein 33 [Salvia splendens]